MLIGATAATPRSWQEARHALSCEARGLRLACAAAVPLRVAPTHNSSPTTHLSRILRLGLLDRQILEQAEQLALEPAIADHVDGLVDGVDLLLAGLRERAFDDP